MKRLSTIKPPKCFNLEQARVLGWIVLGELDKLPAAAHDVKWSITSSRLAKSSANMQMTSVKRKKRRACTMSELLSFGGGCHWRRCVNLSWQPVSFLKSFDEPELLNLDEEIIYLHGRYRLEAAKDVLKADDKWWVVDDISRVVFNEVSLSLRWRALL